jgi:TPR repeat protein
MRFLGEVSAEGRGVPRDPDAAETWYLRAYALDPLPFIPPGISQARRDAFLASDEAIAMLRDRLRRGSPEREQLRLAAALVLRRSPGDLDEAASLAVRYDATEAQPVRLQIARLLLAGAPDEAREATAATLLKGAVSSLQSGSEARALLLALGRKRLAAARTPDERVDAIDLIGAAAIAGEPEPLDALRAAVRRENGGSDPAEVEAAAAMKLVLSSEDYPSYALRQGLEGSVRLRALVDPRGRIVALVPTTAGQAPPLVEGLRRIYARRGPASVEGPVPRPTPWLWMKLPSVRFRIPD